MWLSKLLGGRETDDSEPSRVAPHGNVVAAHGSRRPAKSPGIRPQSATKTKGFDPYNSGAFRKVSAWERVGKR